MFVHLEFVTSFFGLTAYCSGKASDIPFAVMAE
jgi:hypothetical protein